jgi:hypothetical protein
MASFEHVDPTLVCVCGHLGAGHEDSIDAPCMVCDCASFDEDDGQDIPPPVDPEAPDEVRVQQNLKRMEAEAQLGHRLPPDA